jgi:hypothetical protein
MASATPPSPKKESISDLETEKNEKEPSNSPLDDIQSESNQVAEQAEPTSDTPPPPQEERWVSGFKLFTITAVLALVCFLMLLDTSIIVTASIKAQHASILAEW